MEATTSGTCEIGQEPSGAKILWFYKLSFLVWECHICHKPNTAHHQGNTIPTIKHGVDRIILWSSFPAGGTEKLTAIRGKMDEAKFRQTFEENQFLSKIDLCLRQRQH